jgi:hypothetical protein
MVLFTTTAFTLVRFHDNPRITTAAVHALTTGALIAVRLPGIFILVLTVSVFVADYALLPATRNQWLRRIALLLLYALLALGSLVSFWPFLWQHPVIHINEALVDMNHSSRQSNLSVKYLGQFTAASELPWHYIPVWLLISTPLAYTLFFIIGVGLSAWRWIGGFRTHYRRSFIDVVMLACFLGPLLTVILLQSVLYDGWRHMYFIYPAFIFIGLIGMEFLIHGVKKLDNTWRVLGSGVIATLIIVNGVLTTLFMIRNHPHQHLYFNGMAGGMERARSNFDMDYWGLTFRKGLEYIAAHDPRSFIPIAFRNGSVNTVYILPPKTQYRFEVLHHHYAKYILNNYRWQNYESLPHDKEVYAVYVGGVKVMSVFKMH